MERNTISEADVMLHLQILGAGITVSLAVARLEAVLMVLKECVWIGIWMMEHGRWDVVIS